MRVILSLSTFYFWYLILPILQKRENHGSVTIELEFPYQKVVSLCLIKPMVHLKLSLPQ